MKHSGKLWSGEAAKIRRRMRAFAERNVKAKAGESTLGQAWRQSIRRHGDDIEEQVTLYAKAMGITTEDAVRRIQDHHNHLNTCGQPFKR